MHLSPSSFDAADPIKTLCGGRPLLGPWIFTEKDRKVCGNCKRIDKGKHIFTYDGTRWHVRRAVVHQWGFGNNAFWSSTTTTFGMNFNSSSSSANAKITWHWKSAA